MGINRTERVELVNMCMILNSQTNEVLVQDKTDVAWKFGHTFPGGHVEPNEPVAIAMVREVKEETGLEISQLESCGTVEWFDPEAQYRKIGFLFRTTHFSGTLHQSEEGHNFWLPISELNHDNTAESFMEMLSIFTQPTEISATSNVMNGHLVLTAN